MTVEVVQHPPKPRGLSAMAEEGLARLAAWMPFARAAEDLGCFWGVRLDAATVRRHAEAATWPDEQARALKRGPPEVVLAAVPALPVAGMVDLQAAAAARDGTLRYPKKRRDQLRNAEFLATGYPIGSGLVKGGQKVVVQARLKGSGMRWAPGNINPMVALRNIACADRWAEAWPLICRQIRAGARANRTARARPRPEAPPAAVPRDRLIARPRRRGPSSWSTAARPPPIPGNAPS